MRDDGYYKEKLSAARLRRCYDVAPPRVRQYLEAEIGYVLRHVYPADSVLELGCGYGRVLECLAGRAAVVTGIDSSIESLDLARGTTGVGPRCLLAAMDAGSLGFAAGVFDVVACIQNGISAFKVDRHRLIEEAVRVTRPGGKVLFSSYAEGFWEDRLEWFRIQSEHGLLGEIDEDATGNGVIACKDGFRAETVGKDEFLLLTRGIDKNVVIDEVDGSSLFCLITV
jgi:2-polyprenyl-6-hydroxyphenyl methylase/3-demethylubiquinone-9 3-methyltransferase